MLALPPFRGVIRRVILTALVAFFAEALIDNLAQPGVVRLMTHVYLFPVEALHGKVWEFLTYPFAFEGVLSSLFAMISLWLFGALLESEFGGRWMVEYLVATTLGGGLFAALIAATRVLGLDPRFGVGSLWPAVMAIMLAFGWFHGEDDINNIIFVVKAKYLVGIYLVVFLALVLVGNDRVGALTAVCAAGCGYLYLKFAPRRGLSFAASEGLFGLRNSYYRAKRRRAAKKFTVYMKKQGKEVNLDSSGRYVDPDGNPREPRDPNDKRWMN
jgi:membrane associated rhomboid family serine protease